MSQPCLPLRKRKRVGLDVEPGPAPNFDDVSTMDASEYLERVAQQAKTLPDVFVSNEGTAAANNVDGAPRYPSLAPIDGSAASLSYLLSGRASLTSAPTTQHLPSKEWMDVTLENFERLRVYLNECKAQGVGGKGTERVPVPPMKDRAGWHRFCLGADEAQGNTDSYFGDSDEVEQEEDQEKDEIDAKDLSRDKEALAWTRDIPASGHTPSVSLLCQLDQVLVRRLLAHFVWYACEGWSSTTPRCSAWVYALLARLETPIHRDDASELFGLLKLLTVARSSIVVDGSNDTKTELARMNLLILLIGIFFGQGGATVMRCDTEKQQES